MIGAALRMVGNIIYYGVLGTGIVVGTTGGVLYMTKPTDESFKAFIRNYIKHRSCSGNSDNDRVPDAVFKHIEAMLVEKAVDFTIKDFIVFKYASVETPIDKEDVKFVGALQSWLPLDQLAKLVSK